MQWRIETISEPRRSQHRRKAASRCRLFEPNIYLSAAVPYINVLKQFSGLIVLDFPLLEMTYIHLEIAYN